MSTLSELRRQNLKLAKKLVKESVNQDLFIVNAISNVEELAKIANTLTKRLREWYAIYFPELEKKVQDNEAFVKLVLKADKKGLLAEGKDNVKDEMGADLEKQDLEPILSLASIITDLLREKQLLEDYLDKTMKAHAPNLSAVAGSLIGAKLLKEAGSLKRLAMMRSSTIQLLGAEKALFRHIRTGARPPKYGYLLQHQFVQKAKKDERGKAARALADKIFLAVRVDYFKGSYIADKLIAELEERFKISLDKAGDASSRGGRG
ncbi:NOP58 family protein [Candidatus Woesearchaeota archaeon]|nr:NOP58 family protein [Candidatus Woesearchaeota archaeon]